MNKILKICAGSPHAFSFNFHCLYVSDDWEGKDQLCLNAILGIVVHLLDVFFRLNFIPFTYRQTTCSCIWN